MKKRYYAYHHMHTRYTDEEGNCEEDVPEVSYVLGEHAYFWALVKRVLKIERGCTLYIQHEDCDHDPWFLHEDNTITGFFRKSQEKQLTYQTVSAITDK